MNKIEVFRGQIRLNEHKTYFGLDYELTDEIGNLIDNLNKLEKEKQELIDYLKKEQDRLARECSPIYEDGLGKTRLVNEDIYNEVSKILSKIEKE